MHHRHTAAIEKVQRLAGSGDAVPDGAPKVILTFCMGYDWTGKKLALFATSGGSEIRKTAEKLMPYLTGSPEIVGADVFRCAKEGGLGEGEHRIERKEALSV